MRTRRLPAAFALCTALFTGVALPAAAQSTEQQFQTSGASLYASVRVVAPPVGPVLDALKAGLKSQVSYSVRVYSKSTGLFGFLGDKLIGSTRVDYEAYWDEFSGEYVLSAGSRGTKRFASQDDFVDAFFRAADIDTGVAIHGASRLYALTSTQIQIVKLAPPLTMIEPFLHGYRLATPWVKTPLSQPSLN